MRVSRSGQGRALSCPEGKDIDAEIRRLRSIVVQASGPMPLVEMEIAGLERQAEALTLEIK